jgi:hypothetical protein
MNTKTLFEYEWPYLLGCLPASCDLEESARRFGAISRRREVGSASTLLRLALAYGFCDMSLRQTAAWAQAAEVANISDVALLRRLCKAAPWLGYLVATKLADSTPPPSLLPAGHKLRLVDATTVSKPGSTGTDFRLHLGYDLSRQTFDHFELTDRHGGESLTRFAFATGEIVIADRGYSHRRGLYAVIKAGADFILRHNWQNMPLTGPAGEPFDLLAELMDLPDAEARAFAVQVAASRRDGLPAYPAQLVAVRKSEAAAAQTRQQMLSQRSRRQQGLDPRALQMASYLCVLTSMSAAELEATTALELYRFRWQIELAFKRLKSLLQLGKLPAKDEQLARATIFAKLLAALILNDYTDDFLSFFPWGYCLPKTSCVALADRTRADR